ncbi:hypothetical protein EDD29_7133 [Actinocorallia herbida]|uniref:Uncharacterized protein n=1 Tax=Actinocorallia herbida TaxID=58109 RepID=A0A3N1D7J4_9ACTN|nr:hypothetical protein [Actinocorallia herbida]ROO89439.1 hypothetical protein EDD29_7133 [Actinocorallia herbida]
MGELPTPDDVVGYLAASGWVRTGERPGASFWVHKGDHEVLVPEDPALKDASRRLRELLAVLGAVEGRPLSAIAADVAAPAADVLWYRTASDDAPETALTSALATLEGVHGVLGAGARAVLTGPRAAFDGPAPKAARELLARVTVARPSPDLLTVRIPLRVPDAGPLGRRVGLLLHGAVSRLSEGVASGDLAAFDGLVPFGVSADLCKALARFAGPDPGTPFETGFRWARSVPVPATPASAAFGPGAGKLLRHGAFRLRRLRHTGAAEITGRITALVDNGGQDRFRVHVQGEATGADGTVRRALWVRLPDAVAYAAAIAAHRDESPVRVRGVLVPVNGRPELVAGPGELHTLRDGPAPAPTTPRTP